MDHTLDTTLESAARGDEQAWRRIVDEYAPRVFAILRARSGNVDLAEELTQSVFCTVAEKITSADGYAEQGKFEAWLFRIAVNRLRDEIRRRKRQAVNANQEVFENRYLTSIRDAGQNEHRAHLVNIMREILDELSEADRVVIEYRHVAGMSFKQIALLLDEPLGTVLARQHRALAKLRKRMLQRVPEDDALDDF